MTKTILITGSTDGIGLAAAKEFVKLGHHVLLHGRSDSKLDAASEQLLTISPDAQIEAYQADLSIKDDVDELATRIFEHHRNLDVLINNAGVYVTADSMSADGLDVRFMVNTFAPYMLTQLLEPLLGNSGRVINVSSAAQSPVDPESLRVPSSLSDGEVYAQSKLALTMWSRYEALDQADEGPMIVAVNPGSLLDTKMVREAYGRPGADIQIGADILVRAALSDEFADANGLYFDNDAGQFASPHPDAMDAEKIARISLVIEEVLDGK
jgi:NAD(P)-dependent dehydrogenase (short-subunit alcohol dehydrogenase family)